MQKGARDADQDLPMRPSVQKSRKTTEAETSSTAPVRNTVDPSKIYQDFELTLQLSRIEETPILTTALRHIIRKRHKKGKNLPYDRGSGQDPA